MTVDQPLMRFSLLFCLFLIPSCLCFFLLLETLEGNWEKEKGPALESKLFTV